MNCPCYIVDLSPICTPGRLRDLLVLAEKASRSYDPSKDDDEDKVSLSRKTIDLFLKVSFKCRPPFRLVAFLCYNSCPLFFLKFMTSKTGAFLKEPLVHELAEAIDGMASMGENNLMEMSRGLIRPLPG